MSEPHPCPVGTEILRALVGSGLHGTGLPGHEDRDEMGVTLEPPQYVLGLERFEQYEFRTAGGPHARSGPGDLDLVVYSARKYLRLALNGNPSILLLLFVPPEHLVVDTPIGRSLQALAPSIVSRQAGPRFLGYMQAQRDRLLGLRGKGHGNRGGGQRQELIDRFGFDTKFAMHMVRLGVQGAELLRTGHITLPIPDPWGEWLRELRRGEHTQQEALDAVANLENRIKFLMDSNWVRPEPDRERINEWLEATYLRAWQGGED